MKWQVLLPVRSKSTETKHALNKENQQLLASDLQHQVAQNSLLTVFWATGVLKKHKGLGLQVSGRHGHHQVSLSI